MGRLGKNQRPPRGHVALRIWSGTYAIKPGDLEVANHIQVFQYGQCHAFAEAVCQLLPQAELAIADDDDHVLAMIDGQEFDSTGFCDFTYGRDLDDIQELVHEGYLEPQVEEAKPFALAALAEHLGCTCSLTRANNLRRDPACNLHQED